jgi:hypothetical protein
MVVVRQEHIMNHQVLHLLMVVRVVLVVEAEQEMVISEQVAQATLQQFRHHKEIMEEVGQRLLVHYAAVVEAQELLVVMVLHQQQETVVMDYHLQFLAHL